MMGKYFGLEEGLYRLCQDEIAHLRGDGENARKFAGGGTHPLGGNS